MENLFYSFGIIYILKSIHNIYDSIGIKTELESIEDSKDNLELQKIKQDFEEKSNITKLFFKEMTGFICLLWLYFGIKLDLAEYNLFLLGIAITVIFYSYFFVKGMIIGYKSVSEFKPKIYNDLKPKKKYLYFKIYVFFEVIKIIIGVSIVINHFIL